MLGIFSDNGECWNWCRGGGGRSGPGAVFSWLVGAEKMLAGEVGAETILRRNLDRLPPDRWDYVLIDCPPTLGVLTVNALVAVAELLVPVEAHVMALSGLAQLLQTVEVVRERLNPDLKSRAFWPAGWIFGPPCPGGGGGIASAFRDLGRPHRYPGEHPVGRCPSFGQAITNTTAKAPAPRTIGPWPTRSSAKQGVDDMAKRSTIGEIPLDALSRTSAGFRSARSFGGGQSRPGPPCGRRSPSCRRGWRHWRPVPRRSDRGSGFKAAATEAAS